jgi:hypothetical protein
MTRLLRLALLAFALGVPTLAAAPAAQAAAPLPFEEVAQAQNATEAAPRQRNRLQRAERPRTNRQHAQRSRGNREHAQRPRRARTNQG